MVNLLYNKPNLEMEEHLLVATRLNDALSMASAAIEDETKRFAIQTISEAIEARLKAASALLGSGTITRSAA